MSEILRAARLVAYETRQEWLEKDRRGKLGVVLASTAMASRAAFVAPLISKPRTDNWTWKDTALVTGAFVSDFTDGWIARWSGGETTFGAIADPIIDKGVMTTVEAILTLRGELDPRHVAIRALRDIRSTQDRTHALLSGGEPKATRAGKQTTALRMAVDVAAISPIGKRSPRLIAKLQDYTTQKLIMSGHLNHQHYQEESSDNNQNDFSSIGM